MEHGDAGSGLPIGWALIATAVFVLLNGYFVAAEFALVKARPTRIAGLARKGSGSARVVQRILGNLDLYLSACQLGITLASLVLGWLAEPAVAALLLRGAAAIGLEVGDSPALHMVALVIALSVVTVLHMTIGEQAPKMWAIQRAESAATKLAWPLYAFALVFRPVIWVINSLSNTLLRLVGIRGGGAHEGSHDVEELRAILRASSSAGTISVRQRALGDNVLRLMGLEVRHVMLPRVDVVCLDEGAPAADSLAVIRRTGHTRFPLCSSGLDHPIGLVHAKDVLAALIDGRAEPSLRELMRPLGSVPDTLPLSALIVDMQRQQAQLARVVDEHGTAVGVVFLEDAIEEIVGPLYDEFDTAKVEVRELDDGGYELAGNMPLPEAAELLGLDLGTEEDTIAGLLVARLRRIPAQGDQLTIPPYRATAALVARDRVLLVRFERLTSDDDDDPDEPASSPAH